MTVIMGKPIADRPIPLADAMEEEIQVTVWGDVFQVDKHVTRDESKAIYKILFTDYTNSFALKTIVSAEKAHLIDDTLKPGKTLLTSGRVMLDTFDKELLLRPDFHRAGPAYIPPGSPARKSGWSCTCTPICPQWMA